MIINHGGRVSFDVGAKVRILNVDGSISRDFYTVHSTRTDRNALLELNLLDKVIKVHYRRIIPSDAEGRAVVFNSANKYWAVCPVDAGIIEVVGKVDHLVCPKCNQTFGLFLLGDCDMSNVKVDVDEQTTGLVQDGGGCGSAVCEDQPPKPARRAASPRVKKEKEPKPEKPKEPKKEEAPLVDLVALSKLGNCELWTKAGVNFGHDNYVVASHVLVFTTDSAARKLCFNTYNGALGRTTASLPIEDFLGNVQTKGTKRQLWYDVAAAEVEKLRQSLTKKGYVKL